MRSSRVATRTFRRRNENGNHVVGIIEQLNSDGRVCHRWQALQRQVSIGSHRDCSICIEDSELAPVHAVLNFGKRNVFVRSLEGVIRVDDRLVREWLFDHSAHLQVNSIVLRVVPFPEAAKWIAEQKMKEREPQQDSATPIPPGGLDHQVLAEEGQSSAELKQIVEELLLPIRDTLQDVREQLLNSNAPVQTRPEFEHEHATRLVDEMDARIRELLDQKDEHLSAVLQSFQDTITNHKQFVPSTDVTSELVSALHGIQQKLVGMHLDLQAFRSEIKGSLNDFALATRNEGRDELSEQIRSIEDRSERLESFLAQMRDEWMGKPEHVPWERHAARVDDDGSRNGSSAGDEEYRRLSSLPDIEPNQLSNQTNLGQQQQREEVAHEPLENDMEYESEHRYEPSFVPFDPTASFRHSAFARSLSDDAQSSTNVEGEIDEEDASWAEEPSIHPESEARTYLDVEASFNDNERVDVGTYNEASASDEEPWDSEPKVDARIWKLDGQDESASESESSDFGSHGYENSAGSFEEREPRFADEELSQPAQYQPADVQTPHASSREEESIEDYMAQLLRRLRGEGAPNPQSDPPQSESRIASVAPLTTSLRQSMNESATSNPTTPNPSGSAQEPTHRRPTTKEMPNDIAAMREIANNNTRTALHVSTAKRMTSTIQSKIALASIGYSAAIFLTIQNGISFSYATVGILSSLAVGVIWTGEAIVTYRKLRREEKANQAASEKGHGPRPE